MSPKEYKIFKTDAAPFFFYIDVLPLDLTQYDIPHHVKLLKSIQSNPIMPLPLRVDRVYNGEASILVRPRESVSFPIGDKTIYINPDPFISRGIEKLIYLTEVRASREFAYSLTEYNATKWWNSTKCLYGKLKTLEEDFSAFLKAYIYTIVKAKLESRDLLSAAHQYCEIIRNLCNKRISEKQILVEIKEKEKLTELYEMKHGKVIEKRFKRVDSKLLYPTFVDIEVKPLEHYDLKAKNFKSKSKIMKYIPLLFYDDLLECMLQNIETLKEFEGNIIDPSFLFDNKIVMVVDNEISEPKKYSWFKDFDQVDISQIMDSFDPTFPYDLR
ncbi:MAG: hypothetical protein EU535_06510 [Promethearchaeota archaeon]|nr:MAG: hypothetical protein EU535_06510 [Candidatus Lokiarchaeota archaeon]